MSKISSVSREAAIKAFGSVWIAEDMGSGRITEHLGTRKHALHFGETFKDLESARAERPHHEVVYLGNRIVLPSVTPLPIPRQERSAAAIPREIYLVEFDDLLTQGLRLEDASIESVEFEMPPPHLMGKVDFVVGAVIAGPFGKYRVLVEYDEHADIHIAENPMVWDGRDSYVSTGQAIAFFREEDAVREADRIRESLLNAADWRSRLGKAA